MKEPESFIPQLRAILRVAALGPVRMMIPMLTSIEELHQVLYLIERTKQRLHDQGHGPPHGNRIAG
jgi:phosphotransferase system enzyme I (PtsI)